MDPSDIATFKAEGFVVIRGLIPTAQVDAWRSEAWDTLTIDEAEVTNSWPNAGGRNAGLFKPEHAPRLTHPYTDPTDPTDSTCGGFKISANPALSSLLLSSCLLVRASFPLRFPAVLLLHFV